MLKEKGSKIAWIIIILCFIILAIVGQVKIKEQNEVLNNIETKNDVQKNEEEKININEEYKIKGTVSSIIENGIIVVDASGSSHSINLGEFINARTREKMNISNIAVGDYYKNGEIIRNISGEELKKELLLNLARSFNSNKLSAKTIRLKGLEKQEDGTVNFKVRVYDGNYELFGKENPEQFILYLVADENTVLYARTNIVSIYNLQKAVRDEVAVKERDFYIELDETTLNNDRAYVKSFEIAE